MADNHEFEAELAEYKRLIQELGYAPVEDCAHVHSKKEGTVTGSFLLFLSWAKISRTRCSGENPLLSREQETLKLSVHLLRCYE